MGNQDVQKDSSSMATGPRAREVYGAVCVQDTGLQMPLVSFFNILN